MNSNLQALRIKNKENGLNILPNRRDIDMPSLVNSDEEIASDEETTSNEEDETHTGNESSNDDAELSCEVKSHEYEFSHMIAIKMNDREFINKMRKMINQLGNQGWIQEFLVGGDNA